ncbi:TonB family protein [Pseudomonas fildesensis]|uniref:TonB family protein n=1 Tax=Pseudomonas fildesensis TaxID=1674920 RepID=UPI00387B04A7
MRFLVFAAALLCSFHALAEPRPEALYMPKPAYPQGMTAVRGHVLINLKIHNDGSVRDVKALSSTDPAFAAAAVAGASLWRFKPWTVTEDMPAVIDANNDMIFTPIQEGVSYPKAVSGVMFQTCSALNGEIAQWQKDQPSRPLISTRSFALTRTALLMPVLSGERSYDAGLKLTDELEHALPEIVRQCRNNPKARYADYLPASIPRLL